MNRSTASKAGAEALGMATSVAAPSAMPVRSIRSKYSDRAARRNRLAPVHGEAHCAAREVRACAIWRLLTRQGQARRKVGAQESAISRGWHGHQASNELDAHLAPAICKGHCGIQLFVPQRVLHDVRPEASATSPGVHRESEQTLRGVIEGSDGLFLAGTRAGLTKIQGLLVDLLAQHVDLAIIGVAHGQALTFKNVHLL
eukprot:CAMPEP_0181398002 /NCGR_PEP_ID=MMETSP1110-20121109/798_1 /TAXON_ID=174948 /ORGANISM="Symbiodinium sp., Strain CCMP421" /LENGTH=199 /DNA_ID=CAMNT_0023519903 /DNA_START=299 /DNA_END=898 /DNA_ORIENTATION=+